MDRRWFIKLIAWCPVFLTGCRRTSVKASFNDHPKPMPGPMPERTPAKGDGVGSCGIFVSSPPDAASTGTGVNRLLVRFCDPFPPDKASGAHPLRGVLVTAITAGSQIPYCVNVGRVMDVTRLVPEKQGDVYQYSFELDVAKAIGFSGKGLTFYVHASLRQHRSQVIVMHLDA